MACLGNCQLGEQFDVTDQLMFGADDYFPRAQQIAQNQVAVKKSGEKAKIKVDAIVAFADWLKVSNPDIYEAVMQSRPDILMPEFAIAGLGGLSDVAQPTTDTIPITDWGKTTIDFLSPLIGVYSQKQLIDVNVKRAEQGLPPLTDTSAFAPTINVNLPTSAQQQIGDIGKVITVGLLGLGALMLLGKKRR